MGNSILEHRSLKRILTLLLAFAMLAVYIPASVAAAAETPEGTYVLNASDLDTFGTDTKANGDTDQAGTNDYFTLIWASNSRVDESSKEWKEEDWGADVSFKGTKRINFQGSGVTLEGRGISFMTGTAATVKIWWVSGGAGRQMQILDSTGEQVAVTDIETNANDVYFSTLTLDDAGIYYLGSAVNNNYIFKVEVVEAPTSEKTYVLNASDLDTFGTDTKANGDTDQAGTDDYFTLIWASNSRVDESSKEWKEEDWGADVSFKGTKRINFQGSGVTLEGRGIMFTTSAAATVKIWWVSGGAGRQIQILDSDGEQVAVTDIETNANDVYFSTLTLDDADTYYLGSAVNNNYIFKVEVTTGGGRVERPSWDSVDDVPEIVSVEQKGANIEVTVSGQVGTAYADRMTVTMTDESGHSESKNDMRAGNTHVISFSPTTSGKYTFSVVAARNGEEELHAGTGTMTFDFVLPLVAPSFTGDPTSLGGGSMKIAWGAVSEATSYKAWVADASGNVIETKEVTGLSCNFSGLTVGSEYTFYVQAIREGDAEPGPSASIKGTAKQEKEVEWGFAWFGTSTSASKNFYEGNANEGSVTVKAINGGGKLVTDEEEAISYYYTTIDPKSENFVLSANAHVNNWTYSNGQEGFGLMVSDSIGRNGSEPARFNSYKVVATKVEYYWDGYKAVDTSDIKINMRLGIGAQEHSGVTKDNVATLLAYPVSIMKTLETAGGERYSGVNRDFNVVGGATNPNAIPGETLSNAVDFKFTVGKNNTGYFVSYTNAAGKTVTEQYYEPDILNELEEDTVYLGFFASRNADITFEDIELDVHDPSEDPPPATRPITKVTPNFDIVSASISNTPDYDLVYFGNADGTLTVTDAVGRTVYKGPVKAEEKQHIKVTLVEGDNRFVWTMVPDSNYKPSEYEELATYATVKGSHKVTYGYYTRDTIYVSPGGKANAPGTETSPTSLTEAVKWIGPGQTIILKRGTYYMESPLVIERGISGTANNYISMIADPKSNSRPVIDFQGVASGMTLVGDYWYLKGFDVTNSSDGDKGLQVSGNYNVLERILTYRNGNTGIQISRYKASDIMHIEKDKKDYDYYDWPSYNLILNCSSYLNADGGYEDADGFAAKLTVGPGNVFDGCIAAYNADDGWDFFAKGDTGRIGMVTIKNSLAFKNGYDLVNGVEVEAGNGNGFKMGGSNINGEHTLINSVAFANRAKGFDCNSCPDIKVYNSTSFNNENYNVAFYTNDSAARTEFIADGILSYKNSDGNTITEQHKPNVNDNSDYKGPSNYYFNLDGDGKSKNSEGVEVTDGWFVDVDMDKAMFDRSRGIGRNSDGSINMNGFLQLTDLVPEGVGAHLESAKQTESPVEVTGPSSKPGTSSGGGSIGSVGGGSYVVPGNSTNTPSTPSTSTTTTTDPDGTTTTTTTNADGSRSETVVKPDGTRTETVIRNDGTRSLTVTNPDGSKTATVTKTSGAKSEIVTSTNGDVSVTATASSGEVVARVDIPAVVPALSYTFQDVPSGHWAESAINTMAALNVVSGESTDNHVFNMDSNITRGAMAQILFNLSNGTEGKSENFGDVAEGAWYTDAIAWAAGAGVVTGYSDSAFGPNDSITREQLAVMLYRYADLLGVSTSSTAYALNGFSDAGSVNSWSNDAMSWAVSKGLIQGKGANNLDPSASASRAETAVILQRFINLVK